jgi:hypothetical protein
MSRELRRFEVLLPLRFNDGTPVSDELIKDTFVDLEKRFGAVTGESQLLHGRWQHEGQSFRDDLTRVFVDVADTEDNFRWFEEYKNDLKERFQQIEIWLITYPIVAL